MAIDLSSRLAEVVAGQRRVRPLPTLLIALFVTAVVAIPLTERVVRADNASPAADAGLIMVDLADTDPFPLDAATLNGLALISLNDPAALGVSFNMLLAGSDEPVLAAQDLTGPNFFPVTNANGDGRPLDTTLLADGAYELFVTIAAPDGDQRTAVTFVVDNS